MKQKPDWKNGDLVPLYIWCSFCGRNPQEGETFGTGPTDWDFVGVLCPVCWDATTQSEEDIETKP